jgi:glutamate-1-semialdehyde 2,1-aminomutase
MSHSSPEGNVYQAGTLSGNPVAMAAGIAQLKLCLAPGFYDSLDVMCARLAQGIQSHIDAKKYKAKIHFVRSIFWIAFSDADFIRSAEEIDGESMKFFRSMYHDLLEQGIYLGPSGYEVGFVSSAHTDADITETISKFCSALDKVFA